MTKTSARPLNQSTIGVDIVEITRLSRSAKRWGKGFLGKVFTKKELAYAQSKRFPFQHLAARFAAKEAVFKALGDVEKDFVGWKNIEVVNDSTGKPFIVWHGRAEAVRRKRRIRSALVSLSHTEHYAVAVATLLFSTRRGGVVG